LCHPKSADLTGFNNRGVTKKHITDCPGRQIWLEFAYHPVIWLPDSEGANVPLGMDINDPYEK
jgi:hypothetical protein